MIGRRKLAVQIPLVTALFALGLLVPFAAAGKGNGQDHSSRRRPTSTSTTAAAPTTTTTANGRRTSTRTSTIPAPPLPASGSEPRQLGVTLPWSSTWASSIDAFGARVGRMPSVVQMFRDMGDSMFDASQMSEISNRAAVPLITVEPDATHSLESIAAGRFDAWFTAGARAAVSYRRPIYLRFAPEMNGAWEPWGPTHATSQQFVNAWRHIHGIFAVAGATNVLWVWCPNVLSGASDFAPYYPGSDQVDVLGLDGYNWGSLDVWQSWTQVFGSSYDKLATLDATKPVMIAETASTELGGDKAAWITSAFTREIPTRTPRVKIVVWFDENKETDWRVESSTASLNAYRSVATSTAWD